MKQSNWLGEPLICHEHEENGMMTHSKHIKLRTSPTERKKKENNEGKERRNKMPDLAAPFSSNLRYKTS